MQLCFGGKADLPFPLLFLAKVGHSSLRLALTQPLVPSTRPSNPQFFPFRASYLTSSDWHAILPRVCCHQASKCQSKSLSIRAPRSCRLAFTPFPSPRRAARCKSLFSSFLFMRLRTLSFSVSRNSFICHSYENNRGVYQQFPFWFTQSPFCEGNSSHDDSHFFVESFFSETYELPPFSSRRPASLFSCAYKLPISQVLCFDIHASDGGCRG